MYKPALTAGALLAGVAVILGAFGAHALKAVMAPEQLVTFETGVRYQFYHSIALVLGGILYSSFPFKQIKLAYGFFLAGILLFSGSLYLLTLMKANGVVGLSGIGIITPFGGLCFIAGWLLLVLGIAKKK